MKRVSSRGNFQLESFQSQNESLAVGMKHRGRITGTLTKNLLMWKRRPFWRVWINETAAPTWHEPENKAKQTVRNNRMVWWRVNSIWVQNSPVRMAINGDDNVNSDHRIIVGGSNGVMLIASERISSEDYLIEPSEITHIFKKLVCKEFWRSICAVIAAPNLWCEQKVVLF